MALWMLMGVFFFLAALAVSGALLTTDEERI